MKQSINKGNYYLEYRIVQKIEYMNNYLFIYNV